jgi:transcriptional regulator of acetoin/glycerol metabolism
MTNEWLAVNASTNAGARARELCLARDAFLQDMDAAVSVRTPIVESWRRTAAAGTDPAQGGAPTVLDENAAAEVLRGHPLEFAAPLLRDSLTAIAGDAEHLVAISDAEGLLLSVDGDPRTRAAAADELNFVAGAHCGEMAAGTNAIGTALATGRAVQVFAAEHFCEPFQWWTCSAAPIHDPSTGEVLGAIDLTARMETVHPHSLALAIAMASVLEASLRLAPVTGDADTTTAAQRRQSPGAFNGAHPGSAHRRRSAGVVIARDVSEARRPTLKLETLGRDRVRAFIDERELSLSQRHSEILILLAAAPSGLTAEQLAIAVYGDDGKPVTIRAEISRLRRALGQCIQPEPYRLDASVECDFMHVQQLLRDGHPDEAVARYPGPLMPRSEAPGVMVLREELDGWTRRAVMTNDDVEPLWSWLNTPSGDEDLHAWKRFLANLPHADGRRGLAAARLERLRPLLAVTPN